MAYAAKWSIPDLESKGFPKQEELFSFSTSLGKAAKTFEVLKETDASVLFLYRAKKANQTIPLITVFLERIENGKTVIYAKYDFRKCRFDDIRFAAPNLVSGAAGSKHSNRFEEKELEFVKVIFDTMDETLGKDFGEPGTNDSWKE